MVLPTYEEVSIGITKQFVDKHDIDSFSSYINLSMKELHLLKVKQKNVTCEMQ